MSLQTNERKFYMTRTTTLVSLRNVHLFWLSILIAAMGIGGGSRECCRKCRPMWDLRWQKKKIADVRVSMSVVFIFTTYIIVQYF